MGPRLGIVLAAGAGSRMGTPKALVRAEDGRTWAARAAGVLVEGGCDDVLVVLGAQADTAAAALPAGTAVVVAQRWSDGVSESLAAGLRAAREREPEPAVAVIHLVDLPGVTPEAVRRLLSLAGAGADVLARATYRGEPGHPVVLGRAHWAAVLDQLDGDRGAARYLAEHDTLAVECADVADGSDVDTPAGRPSSRDDG